MRHFAKIAIVASSRQSSGSPVDTDELGRLCPDAVIITVSDTAGKGEQDDGHLVVQVQKTLVDWAVAVKARLLDMGVDLVINQVGPVLGQVFSASSTGERALMVVSTVGDLTDWQTRQATKRHVTERANHCFIASNGAHMLRHRAAFASLEAVILHLRHYAARLRAA